MERLQSALEKARAQRAGQRNERQDVRPGTAASTAPEAESTPVEDAWRALKEIKISNKLLLQNRIVTATGGPEASNYDLLRTKLLQQCRQNKWKRIAVISTTGAAGKSTTVANLAFSFSRQSDVRAMIFDFDLRRPTLARILGQQSPGNMERVLSGDAPFDAHALRIGMNLGLALNDKASHKPSELLQSHYTHDLLAAVEEAYATDLMLFDMPPMLAVDDAYGFLRSVDGALIIMEAEKTPIKQIDVIERQVAELTNVVGIVLNKCNYTDDIYGSYYGYY